MFQLTKFVCLFDCNLYCLPSWFELKIFKQKEFEKKAPQALLTEADLEAQRLIVGGLTTAFPELPIVGEEDESLAGETLPSIQV